MFNDSGNKLKSLAKAVLVISLIATLVLAILLGKDRFDDFDFWRFLGILIGGSILSYIEALFLYAFGELVHSAEMSRDHLQQMTVSIERVREGIDAMQRNCAAPAVVSVKAPAVASVKAEPPVVRPPAAPSPAPAQNAAADANRKGVSQPAGGPGRTYQEHLRYALDFTTDDGMIRYLQGCLKKGAAPESASSPEEVSQLDQLLRLPPAAMRAEIRKILDAGK